MERRLAAILAADVVGYSRLMGQDEAGTLGRLKTAREEVLQPLIAEHRGRIVKLMGDGLLVEFASVVDAVECARAWQERMARRESDRDEDGRLLLRIGINLGDVIIDGEDIYGDGSTSPPDWRPWRSPRASASRAASTSRSATRPAMLSGTSARRR